MMLYVTLWFENYKANSVGEDYSDVNYCVAISRAAVDDDLLSTGAVVRLDAKTTPSAR